MVDIGFPSWVEVEGSKVESVGELQVVDNFLGVVQEPKVEFVGEVLVGVEGVEEQVGVVDNHHGEAEELVVEGFQVEVGAGEQVEVVGNHHEELEEAEGLVVGVVEELIGIVDVETIPGVGSVEAGVEVAEELTGIFGVQTTQEVESVEEVLVEVVEDLGIDLEAVVVGSVEVVLLGVEELHLGNLLVGEVEEGSLEEFVEEGAGVEVEAVVGIDLGVAEEDFVGEFLVEVEEVEELHPIHWKLGNSHH